MSNMENNMRDILQCEEDLKSTLHCDDKEKLRRKLAVLQGEYLKTAQRLQRAERLDAVRRHVRSRITQHNHQDQRDPELTSNTRLNPSLLTLNTTSETAQRGHNEGAADSDSSKRSQVIRFLLPSDAACPQTPDLSYDVATGHRSSPTMRLRSRSSRLRWERRSTESTEAGRMTDKSEETQEQSEKREAIRIEGEKDKIKSEEMGLINEKELFSDSESSESPSLLLTHWNTYAITETGDMERVEIEEHQEPRENESDLRVGEEKQSESTPLPLEACETDMHIEEGGQDSTQNGIIEEREPGEEEQNESEKTEHEKRQVNTTEIKEDKSETEQGGKTVGLLDCCTLVEGLLFPVEYYVRTTRRMTLSQSQPDMQAVILSQLSTGRHRRSRGRGRRSVLNRKTQTNEHALTDFSSLATTPVQSPKLSHVQAAGFCADLTGNSQSSSGVLDQLSDSQNKRNHVSSPADCSYRSGRGRRRKRGRGRGRPHMPRSSLGLDTNNLGLGKLSDSAQPTSTPVSPSLSHYSADEPASCLSSQEAVPVTNDNLPTSSHTTPSQISSEINGAQSRTMTARLETVYPVFLKSNVRNKGLTEMNTRTSTWESLLLTSSPSTQSCFHSIPFRSLGSLASSLMKFDIQQDFHLPDDQFASLKLNKLRQVTVKSAVESFTSPYNTRNSKRLSNSSCSDPVMPFPLPLSLTPTITKSPRSTGDKQATTQSVDLENLSVDHKLENQSSADVSADTTDAPGDQQTENLHAKTLTTSHESVSLADHLAADCANRCKENETVILFSYNKSNILTSNTDRPADKVNVTEHSNDPKIKQPATEKRANCICAVHSLEERRSKNHQTEQNTTTKTRHEASEEVSYNCTAGETCNDAEALGDSAVKDLSVKSPARDLKGPYEGTTSPAGDKSVETKHLEHHHGRSQLLLSPLASASCPFMSSSAYLSSPTLPSLGLTPHLASPQTSSPSALSLRLPPPHTPSSQAPSPPVLSPCPSCTSLPPSLPPASPSCQIPSSLDGCHRVDPPPRMQSQGSGGLINQGIGETANECMLKPLHTLKAPAGSCLVGACCLPAHSGGLCVAASGKLAVCLWSQISASDWSLIHTWTFKEPVINVFPVPDAADLMCVTLGQVEIREVRMLSCSVLSQALLYEGVVQAVVGVSKSRVVLSSHSATGSSLQVFNLSDSISTPASRHLVSPGVCIGALAPVDGLPDALIGTDDCGHLFIWNLNTGQVLQSVTLGDDLSHTACLRGYSYCGVLFVLLQHQLLSSLEEEEKEAKVKDQMFPDGEEEAEKKKTAVFSLVAVNPMSGKSVLAAKLHPPKSWSGRLCEADANSFSVVGLSQSGCVCVWELNRQGDPRMVWAPEGKGWQLARWGGGDVLVTGHLNGDVTLHSYSHNSLCC